MADNKKPINIGFGGSANVPGWGTFSTGSNADGSATANTQGLTAAQKMALEAFVQKVNEERKKK